jgi:LysR family nitrogen assimilation transcriptional regulator
MARTIVEIRRIFYFARIAEDGSLTKAAGVLRIAQPALSRQLRLLEKELGVSLFIRTARGMRLTEEGEYLREAVTDPLRTIEFALKNVRSLASGTHGSIVIGMPSNLGDVLATRFVLLLAKDFPEIKLQVVEGSTGNLIEWLNRGIIDCALLDNTSEDERLVDSLLHCEPLVLIGGPESALAHDRPVTLAKALGLPLILQSHHLGVRATINQAAAKLGVSVTPKIEAYSARLIMDLVEHGDGYGLMPAFCLVGRALKSAPIVSPALQFNVFLTVRLNDRTRNQRVSEALLSTFRSLFAGMK